jgi:hypothetical protein
MIPVPKIYNIIQQKNIDPMVKWKINLAFAKQYYAQQPNLIANCCDLDRMIYKYCNVHTQYQKIEAIKYTRCDNCNIKL